MHRTGKFRRSFQESQARRKNKLLKIYNRKGQSINGKQFNFGLLEFYRLKEKYPDIYEYMPNRNFKARKLFI